MAERKRDVQCESALTHIRGIRPATPRKAEAPVQDKRYTDRDSKGVSSEDGAAILNEESRHAVILCRTECKKPDIILSNNKTNIT